MPEINPALDFQTLVQLPEARRDEAWENHFLDALVNRQIKLENEDPQTGPDGWPYLKIKTSEGAEPFARVADWCATRGIGLVINAHKMIPDYVFTYGMLWNFKEFTRFVQPQSERKTGDFTPPKNAIMGAPTPKYLPNYVRKVLREFLREQTFQRPKVLVVSSEDYKDVDLIFSEESLNNLQKKEHAVLAEALHWFLPTHYNLVIASEQNLPKFTDL